MGYLPSIYILAAAQFQYLAAKPMLRDGVSDHSDSAIESDTQIPMQGVNVLCVLRITDTNRFQTEAIYGNCLRTFC